MDKETFIKELEKLNITLSSEQLAKLHHFYELLISWNQKINLTRITEENEVYLKHFYDSLTLVKAVDLTKNLTLCDIGTGAGFPGIVLKIVFPNLKITLIDSLQKRVNYLNEIIKDLDLKDISAIHSRGEDHHEQYDIVTARAVANIKKLVKYTMHLVKKDGLFIAMKGNLTEELSPEVKKSLQNKYQIYQIIEFNLPIENSKRSLLCLKNK